ncbi:MAG: S8 family serine peptidase [Geminicoccaceae bacterium]
MGQAKASLKPSSPTMAAGIGSDQGEYENQNGLSEIKAARGYAARRLGSEGGAGVRVAVIDGVVDRGHADLAGAVAGVPYFEAKSIDQPSQHATHVAGIIAARKDGSGRSSNMHGVAYKAQIVSIAEALPDPDDPRRGIYSYRDVAHGIASAAGISGRNYNGSFGERTDGSLEADVINLSLGGGSRHWSVVQAMRDAAKAGKIMVLAAGNDALTEPTVPANLARRRDMQGLAIVVGNWDHTIDRDHWSSNICGRQANHCLFAPGTSINSTLPGGGYGTATGTSMAAPHVAGAAAVVKGAFPGISSKEVVDRLLLTAEDLGAPGVDPWYGHGLLDLEAAMMPVGSLSVPQGSSIDGPSVSLEASELEVSSAFGTGLAGSGAFDDALALDEMGFPFQADLNQRVNLIERDSGLERFIAGGAMTQTGLRSRFGDIQLGIAEEQLYRDETRHRSLAEHREIQDTGAPAFRWRMGLSESVDAFVNLEGGAAPTAGLMETVHRTGAGLFEEGQFLAPYDDLAGTVHGAGLSIATGDSGTLTVQGFTSSQTAEDTVQLAKMDYSYQLSQNSALHLGMGSLEEQDGFLGSSASGAFGENMDGASSYMTVGLSHALGERTTLFGSYTEGRTQVSGGGALGDLSAVRANAFGAGAVFHDLRQEGDGFTVMVGQPLRVYEAEAEVEIATGRNPDGSLVRERQQVDYAAQGRESFISAHYATPMGETSSLEFGMMVRMQPDHDPDAATDIGFGARYHIGF